MDTITTQTIKKIDEIEKDMAAKELGEEIKRLRLKAGWSQEELAQRIGLHQTRVSSIESGEHNYPLETVYRLAISFSINPFELAAIYWGIEVQELTNRDRELLNNLLSLFDDYRKDVPGLPKSQIPPRRFQENPETDAGIEEGMQGPRAKAAKVKKASQKQKPPDAQPDNE